MYEIQTTVLGFPVHRNGYVSKANQANIELIKWERDAADAPDKWLRTIVARYIKLFYLKRLNGHPAAETLPIVAESWVEDIGYNLTEEIDSERVISGFRLLSRSINKWPQPADLLKALPGRIVINESTAAIAPISDEIQARSAAELDNILNMLNED